jgi:hypothetical protein
MHVDLAADLSALRSHGREELEADAEEETDEPVREREAEDVSVLPLSAKKEEVGLRRGVGSGAGRRRLQCHAKNRRPTLLSARVGLRDKAHTGFEPVPPP